ncbi:MAG: septum site-determining protein MinC [Lachnospiraceae bacterium]|nr:septum site-determining protein MinC [Lachnospiraceae bacterium]
MNHLVIIKSFSKGISLILDKDADFEDLLREVVTRFMESSDFFKDARIALSFEGRLLSTEEEERIIDAIEQNSRVKVVCILDKDETSNKIYIKALEQLDPHVSPDASHEECQIHFGSLSNGETLESNKSLLILGDVSEGALVVSDRSVFVLGTLEGEVFCGNDKTNQGQVMIYAHNFVPTRVKIGPFRINDKELKSKKHFMKKCAQIAYLQDDKIVVENFNSSIWNTLKLF